MRSIHDSRPAKGPRSSPRKRWPQGSFRRAMSHFSLRSARSPRAWFASTTSARTWAPRCLRRWSRTCRPRRGRRSQRARARSPDHLTEYAMDAPIYVIDSARTPFLKSRNRPGPFAASDLATDAGRALLLRQPFAPADLDEVILGCAAPSVDEVNIGRVVALRMGCGHKVPGWTVMRNCASGMQAIDSAMDSMRVGRSQLVLAGGVDALSRAPLLFSDAMVAWLASWYAAKTLGRRAAL